jgi:hypothetical protein
MFTKHYRGNKKMDGVRVFGTLFDLREHRFSGPAFPAF